MTEKKHCSKCGNTGVNDTGNNDLPCDCSAGDKAIFNDVHYGTVTGKFLKEVLGIRQQNSFGYGNDL